MIAYLIKSAVCMILLLAVYHSFFEKEKMHRFNRIFLLFSIVFSLLAPATTIYMVQQDLPASALAPIGYVNALSEVAPPPVAVHTAKPIIINTDYTFKTIDYVIILYALVALILAIRFAANLLSIYLRAGRGSSLMMDNATIVLVKHEVTPHSFLNYIFINETQYYNHIEDCVLLHELTHVKQKHSLDIIFIELTKIIFWFNPILILYKRAMQLNHEFLADEGVLAINISIKDYQHLLLSKAGLGQGLNLASNFNYCVTKKRLMMMNRTTPKLRATLKGLALIPFVLVIAFFTCIKAEAQQQQTAPADTVLTKTGVMQRTAARQNRGPFVSKLDKDGKLKFYKYYADLTPAEQLMFRKPGTFYKPAKKSPTANQFKAWKNGSVFGVWIDGKRTANEELNNFEATDFVFYFDSKLSKQAINYGKHYYQIDLYTVTGYNSAFKNWKDRKTNKMSTASAAEETTDIKAGR